MNFSQLTAVTPSTNLSLAGQVGAGAGATGGISTFTKFKRSHTSLSKDEIQFKTYAAHQKRWEPSEGEILETNQDD
jgi:hypothetical protein